MMLRRARIQPCKVGTIEVNGWFLCNSTHFFTRLVYREWPFLHNAYLERIWLVRELLAERHIWRLTCNKTTMWQQMIYYVNRDTSDIISYICDRMFSRRKWPNPSFSPLTLFTPQHAFPWHFSDSFYFISQMKYLSPIEKYILFSTKDLYWKLKLDDTMLLSNRHNQNFLFTYKFGVKVKHNIT